MKNEILKILLKGKKDQSLGEIFKLAEFWIKTDGQELSYALKVKYIFWK